MTDESLHNLSRRERQIMDIILRKGNATVIDVQRELDGEPNYSTVRALMRILEEKGYLKHEAQGVKYVYSPQISKKNAEKNAIRNLLSTFFNNSAEKAVAAFIEHEKSNLKAKDLDRLSEIINKARKESENNDK